jgi:hypothetical protein
MTLLPSEVPRCSQGALALPNRCRLGFVSSLGEDTTERRSAWLEQRDLGKSHFVLLLQVGGHSVAQKGYISPADTLGEESIWVQLSC